jgi:transposase-like protein
MGREILSNSAELEPGLAGGHPILRVLADVRRILSATNAIEALNAKPRRAVQARGHFLTDEAAIK